MDKKPLWVTEDTRTRFNVFKAQNNIKDSDKAVDHLLAQVGL